MCKYSNIAKKVVASGNRSQYDIEAINLIKDKQILARILKECTTEFKDMEIEEIIPCIDTPVVETIPVEPGFTDTPVPSESGPTDTQCGRGDRVIGTPTESKIIGEGTITFDIRFTASLPRQAVTQQEDVSNKLTHPDKTGFGKVRKKQVEIHLSIDVELQRKEDPGYDIIPRAVFYCGRMLSEQMGHNITGENYDNLQKVYSIWICMNAALSRAYTIGRYALTYEPVYGDLENESAYDFLQIIVIRLPGENKKGKPARKPTPLMRLLSDLFSQNSTPSQKLRKLSSQGIRITEEIGERVNVMCNLSEGIYENGFENGFDNGFDNGVVNSVKIFDRICNDYGSEEARRAVANMELLHKYSVLYGIPLKSKNS